MKALQHPVFIICVVLFSLNQVLERIQKRIWPLHSHLDDLLCLPLVLTLILAAERLYFHNPYFVLPKRYLLYALLLFSLVFEVLLPAFSARYTADAWDVVAYALGAVIFQKSINVTDATEALNKP